MERNVDLVFLGEDLIAVNFYYGAFLNYSAVNRDCSVYGNLPGLYKFVSLSSGTESARGDVFVYPYSHVFTASASQWKVGDAVTVAASRQMATQALLLAFGLPLVIMLAVLLAVLSLTGREGLSALCALGSLLPYYGVLWLLRGRLQQRMAFWIEE